MKHEWKKLEKELYLPKNAPTIVNVPKMKFLTIKGIGNPNNEDFQNRVGVLYSLSYAIKMLPKKGYDINGYFDYSVYPLEGTWDLTEKGRESNNLIKDELLYTIMIRQPDFVDVDTFNKALEIVKEKKPSNLLDSVRFEEVEEGLCVQMLHIGPYDDEPNSFKMMKEFIMENNLKIKTLVHREIYISDARKTSSDKLKTVLRYRVTK